MPLYEYEWIETRHLKTRIHVPTDTLALKAAQTDDFVKFAQADEAPIIADAVTQVEVTAVARVVQVEIEPDPAFPDVTTVREELRPL